MAFKKTKQRALLVVSSCGFNTFSLTSRRVRPSGGSQKCTPAVARSAEATSTQVKTQGKDPHPERHASGQENFPAERPTEWKAVLKAGARAGTLGDRRARVGLLLLFNQKL